MTEVNLKGLFEILARAGQVRAGARAYVILRPHFLVRARFRENEGRVELAARATVRVELL